MSVRLLVLPIFRNQWLYHVMEGPPAALQQAASRSWQDGKSFEEKLKILGEQVSSRVKSNVFEKWRQVETAKEGTFKHRLYRLAQILLSREDPLESFFKSLPKDCTSAEIIYPASMNQVLVRRRTRQLAKLRIPLHKRYMAMWALSTIPQTPLALIPLPNVPFYFTAYKVLSHYQARNGASALSALFQQQDARQQREQMELVASWARDGITFEPGSWPDNLLREDPRHLDLVAGLEHKAKQELGLVAEQEAALQPRFIPDEDVDAIIRPLDRSKTPLSNEAVRALSEKLGLPHLEDHVARVRRLIEKSRK